MKRDKKKMAKKKSCCDVIGNKLNSNKNWIRFKRANGEEWIPAFLQYVDAKRCIGCGECVKVCLGNCYELQEKIINGKKKKISIVIRKENCFGDCHCHKVCPVPGTIICKPKLVEETE